MSVRLFGKFYWDTDVKPEIRVVAAYVEFRCASKPCEIVESDFAKALCLGRSATRSAINKAIKARLIERNRSKRGDGRGVYVYRSVVTQAPEPVQPGSLYVIEFSDGTVKVGKSFVAEKRLEQHKGTAASFGMTITRSWSSPRSDRYEAAECEVLTELRSLVPCRGNSEYFIGGYDLAVDLATKAIGGAQ